MPTLDRGRRPIHHPAGSLIASGTAKRELIGSSHTARGIEARKKDPHKEDLIRFQIDAFSLEQAFKEAVKAFYNEFGRFPEWDLLVFTGAIATNEIVVEIAEYPEEQL